jgi:hypothetical protein
MNERQNPHQQRLRPISLDVQRSTTVQIRRPDTRRKEAPSVKVPEIGPELRYLMQLATAEKKHIIEQVQKMVYENNDLTIAVRTYDIEEVLRDLAQPVASYDGEPMTIPPLSEPEPEPEPEVDEELEKLKHDTFFYDL